MSIKSWGINLSYRVRQIISLLFILVFFSPSHCFTGILPCPRIILLYNIKEKKQSAVEFSYSHPIRQNARQHLLDSFSLQRIFLPGCSDKLRSVTKGFSFLFCRSVHWSKNKNMHGLFFGSLLLYLPPLLTPPSLCFSVVFAFFCSALQCAARCFGCSRLDCYTDQQRASAFSFVWHEQCASPDKHTMHLLTDNHKNVH